jgi:DNA-binding response OmpR family regulator
MRLLMAEDSVRLQELLRETLRRDYRLDIVSSCSDLVSATEAVSYDLLIVDLGLPDGDGIDAIRELRARKITAPILIMTARDAVEDRIRGLDSGADDYLTKPFNNGELLARIRALLRRPALVSAPVLKLGPLEYDETTGQVLMNGKFVDLRPSERKLLAVLMRYNGTIAPKSSIEEQLSEFDREITSNALEILVSRLRKAIGASGVNEVRIETIRGIGYALRTRGPN